MICHIEGGTWAKGVQELGAEEDIINFQVPYNAENFLISQGIIIFTRRHLLHGVILVSE